ncbi:MAG TPA: hypothetical protein VK453_12965 [Micromonosporaceae bacterium]|nr:hypothetical protein [Micromonosporaceae bacterium]
MRAFAAVVAALLATGSVAACATKTIEYQGDYPMYESLEAIYAKANLVIEARIGAAERVQELRPTVTGTDPEANPQAGAGHPPAAVDDVVVVTVRPVEVVRTFKGDAKPGEVVEVGELGGEYKGVRYAQSGATSLKAGTTYLLFLEVYPAAPAALLNPTQAQYPVDAAGRLTPLKDNELRFTVDDLRKLSTVGP